MNNKLTVTLSVAMFFSIFSYSTFNTKAEENNSNRRMSFSDFSKAISSQSGKADIAGIIAGSEEISKNAEDRTSKIESIRKKRAQAINMEGELKNTGIKQDKMEKETKTRKELVDKAVLSSKSSDTSTVFFASVVSEKIN